MTTPLVLVHGFPETAEIWSPLESALDRPAVALRLPGFGSPRPFGFAATKDAYAEWLAGQLREFEKPVDVVAHDVGALLTMRVVSALDAPLRSWVVDVAPIFHPAFEWPQRMWDLQTPGVGEELLAANRIAEYPDPQSTAARLESAGTPTELARSIGARHDEVMSRSILDFYRSAAPNVAADWWDDARAARARGLILLLPDPPEEEALSLEVAARLGAETVRLDGVNHCWMAEAPEQVAIVLRRFWA